MSEKPENSKQREKRIQLQLKQWRAFLVKEPQTAEKAMKRALGLLMSNGVSCPHDQTKYYYEMKNGVSCPSDFGVSEKFQCLQVA